MAATTETTQSTSQNLNIDPFASQRASDPESPVFNASSHEDASPVKTEPISIGSKPRHEEADEWDASKTPPSRFQQRKGSIFATPGSRDGHVDRNNERDAKYHEKLAEKGWGAKFRRGSKSS